MIEQPLESPYYPHELAYRLPVGTKCFLVTDYLSSTYVVYFNGRDFITEARLYRDKEGVFLWTSSKWEVHVGSNERVIVIPDDLAQSKEAIAAFGAMLGIATPTKFLLR